MEKKQAVLLLTNRKDRKLVELYQQLKNGIGPNDDVFLLYHQTSNRLPKCVLRCNHFSFSYDSLSELKYIPIAETLIPGSNHFPVLSFFIKNPHYQYYWCIEDDVRFNGSWKYFFESIDQYDNDFFTSQIKRFHDDPLWSWWNTLGHPSNSLPINSRIKSFNPIYRISDSALKYLDKCLKDRWFGHHEVLIPTLLHEKEFKISDFGGGVEFAETNMNAKFYTDEIIKSGHLESTVRWRPIMEKVGEITNMLYHPVKEVHRIRQSP